MGRRATSVLLVVHCKHISSVMVPAKYVAEPAVGVVQTCFGEVADFHSIEFSITPEACSGLLALQVIDDYSGQSFRVLALARGVLRGREREALTCMGQEQLEAQVERFELVGLLVLSNHLRPDSKDTIHQLQHQ